MTIHQEISFAAAPGQLFAALTDAESFAAATGAPASMSAQEGGAFACFGEQITGRFVELVPDERIVQAWRVGAWPPGVYSLVTMTLAKDGAGTRLTLDQAGHPPDAEAHLDGGWGKMYWEPLKAFLD